jgi:AcrR family transcriptional regulator
MNFIHLLEEQMPRTKAAFQQIRDQSRQHILKEAAEVFITKGLSNTKIADLAEAAGVSQGLLYRYFTDKEDVFIALLETAVQGVTDYVRTAIGHTGTPFEKLHWLTEQVLHGMAQEPVYFQLISQAMAIPGKVQDSLWRFELVSNKLRELIAEGQSTGDIAERDPDQLMLLYFSCLFGLAAGKSTNIQWIDEHFPTAEAVLQILKP